MTILSFTEIKNNLLSFMENILSKIEGAYNYDIASMAASGIKKLYDYMTYWGKQTFIDTATEDQFVDKHAVVFGVERLNSTLAFGEITITGKVGAKINPGYVVISRNNIEYQTTEILYLDSAGQGIVSIECLIGGVIGNCGPGDITNYKIANPDIYTIVNEKEVVGGYDVEPNESLIIRAQEHALRPAHSGNNNDYYKWCKEVPGVGKVKIIPLWNGNGTVKCVISDVNAGIASDELITEVKSYIEDDRRPVGADVTVSSFLEFLLDVESTIVMIDGYNIVDITNSIISELNYGIINETITYETPDNETVLSHSKVNNLILNTEGVLDVLSLTLNGQSSNLIVGLEYIIKVDEVLIHDSI